MKRLEEMLLTREAGSEIMIGNTAVVRAMIESGVKVVTSYPGSPTPEIAQAIMSVPADRNPLHFQFSVNEKVATEVAFGASINGHLSCVFFKSVGLNVASDTFVQLSLMELIGGMVVMIGDDPGANSSQNEQDNRHYALMSYTPVFEPSTPQEAYAMFKEATRISKEMKMPIILRLTTHVCHAKERVAFGTWSPEETDSKSRFDVDNGPYIPITSVSLKMKRRALEKLESFRDYSEDSALNRIVDNHSNKGIISSGTAFLSLMDCVLEMDEKPDILKLGITNPLPKELIESFLRNHSEVKVLEELDQVIEQQVKSLAYDRRTKTRIIGKEHIDDFIGEYLPDKVREIISRTWPGTVEPSHEAPSSVEIPARPAQMCPGCGHRSAFFAVKSALKKIDITVADIGCHTLGAFEPYNLGQVLLCMGHCSGTGSGLSLFNDERRVVAFIGDSTLFHAGLPGIINAVYNNHKMTLIVMENGTTAMTGHQDHPGSGSSVRGPATKISIRKLLDALGVEFIEEVDTYQQTKLKKLVEDALGFDGFSVVIARHPCMLKFTREQRRKLKTMPKPVRVGPKCDRRYVCVKRFACPTFQRGEDGSVWVQEDLCIGDRSCMQTCPVDAIIPSE